MTTACCNDEMRPLVAPFGDRFDILRGVGLAVSITVIVLAPLTLALLAWMQG